MKRKPVLASYCPTRATKKNTDVEKNQEPREVQTQLWQISVLSQYRDQLFKFHLAFHLH